MLGEEEFDLKVSWAATHAEGGRLLEELNVRIAWESLKQYRAANLLALAAQLPGQAAVARAMRREAAALIGADAASMILAPQPIPSGVRQAAPPSASAG